MTESLIQRALLLKLLILAGGDWVPLSRILEVGITDHEAKISALRSVGLSIRKCTRTLHGQRQTCYRIETRYPD